MRHKNSLHPTPEAKPCPCGSGALYSACCGPLHAGETAATNAEQLMRSRYSAYVLEQTDYLMDSWHASTRPADLTPPRDESRQWLGLKIRSTDAGLADDKHGQVEFIARYKINGKAHRLHETSRFVQENGRWYYLDGDLHAS